MKRRDMLKSALAGATVLGAPRLGRAAGQNVINFIPQSDLASYDPVWTTADVTRNHALLVFDTLYGHDADFSAQPQMAAGHQVGADGKQWDITLRDGLKLPRQDAGAGAGLRRQHPALVAARSDSAGADARRRTRFSAPSDKVIRFRLKKPFPLLPMRSRTTTCAASCRSAWRRPIR